MSQNMGSMVGVMVGALTFMADLLGSRWFRRFSHASLLVRPCFPQAWVMVGGWVVKSNRSRHPVTTSTDGVVAVDESYPPLGSRLVWVSGFHIMWGLLHWSAVSERPYAGAWVVAAW